MSEFEKKISVIIPVYNTERYIAQCIDSILASPLEDIEVIAVDDGSLDRSLEILMMYKDPRLKVFSKRSEGMFRTWKYGVERASGEYIVFVDADDYVSPALFETVERLRSHPARLGGSLRALRKKDVRFARYPARGIPWRRA